MSSQQAAVERLFNEVVNAGNLDAADEVLAHDFVDHGPMGAMPGLEAFKLEYVTPNVARFEGGKVVEHWSDQGMFQFMTQIGALDQQTPAQG